ncbi:MAG TPA: hypothetical protein ENK26_00380 [Gammaproteobacteria bacterium]|nr:hypothetical protein [Gammaproteobacteria bacterium]
MPINRGNLLFLLTLVSATALSASAPPATLPRGFLEKLPMLMDLPDAEYEALLRTSATPLPENKSPDGDKPKAGQPKRRGRP